VLPVPSATYDILGKYVGQNVYFGIRPEDVHDAHFVPRGVDESAKIPTQVTLIEPMGAEVYAAVERGGKELMGRFDPRTQARLGQPLDVVLDMSKMHIFDRETEKALV
jgi:multiple sugar transport system ATP-binding protein